MNKKSKAFVIVSMAILGVIIVASCVLLILTLVKNNEYKNSLENQYQRSYMQLLENVDDIEVDLSKLIATTSHDSQKSILQSVYTNCVLAGENISSMPVSLDSLVNVNNVINKVGGYVYSLILNDTVVEGEVLTSIEGLHENLSVIKYDLNKGYSDVLNNSVVLTEVTYGEEGSSFTAGLVGGGNSYSSVPTLIYDGPFSESVMNKEPILLEEIITQEEAYILVSELAEKWEGYEIEYLGTTLGKLDTYNYKLSSGENELFVQILQNGGKLLSANSYGNYEGEYIDEVGAIKLAKNIAFDFGYGDMVEVWTQTVGNIIYINLAPIEDGVIYYSDLVKVKIDLNGGEIVGWEGTNYIYNHHERGAYTSSLSIVEAQYLLSDSLEVQERNYCVIPNEYIGETNAFEYKCVWSGYTYYVYLDSNTGKELNIMRVIETDNGNLLA